MTSSYDSDASRSDIPRLRTADQHDAWRARVADRCWTKTGKDILVVTDNACTTALQAAQRDDVKGDEHKWVAKCWEVITKSLHDDVLLKVAHIERGRIATLLKEIAASLTVNTFDEVNPLRLELYGSSMQKCGCDLASYIAYIQVRDKKLTFLKKPVPEDELISIFINGLHPVLTPLKIHLRIVDLKKWDEVIQLVRIHCAGPEVAAELLKLKSAGLSQHMFPMTTTQAPPQALPQPQQAQRQPQACRNFARGKCTFGTNCRWSHSPIPNQTHNSAPHTVIRCAFCCIKGHGAQDCRKRLAELANQTRSQTALVAQAAPGNDHAQPEDQPSESQQVPSDNPQPNFFSFVFLTATGTHIDSWVIDSGATSSGTFDERDCVDIRPCDIKITAAGSSFNVTKIGTAIITAMAENGQQQKITLANCLISPLFPCKLLSLASLTKKGLVVHMTNDTMKISNPINDVVLLGKRDDRSQLFLLQEAAKPSDTALLAKSYQAGPTGTSDSNLLWKLHLRHGHRNFADLARQYKLPMPKQTPSCTSCVMGKSHLHPKLSDGFQRATRKAEGFHSDFRGPFSVPTPEGYLYLLTLIDDYTRRIFGFLVKSQTEWMDIWPKFVVRVEAELGKTNCISWLLSDNGAVYKSMAMNQFCSTRGIQQRYSGPYSQWMNHTAERNMRTIGEMATTTMIHANLPKRTWGYATMLAIDVINRTADCVQPNFKNTLTRLERWKGKDLPGQTKGLYPFGCLVFKHVPPPLRTKLDAHASPHVYLGIDPKSHAYLLGSLYDLKLSVTVEATFLEHVFPFRRVQSEDSPSTLLWGTESTQPEGDLRRGMFENQDAPNQADMKPVDLRTLKNLYGRSQQLEPDRKDSVPPIPERKEPKAVIPPTLAQIVERDSLSVLPLHDYADEEDQEQRLYVVLSESMLQTATPRYAHQAVSAPRAPHWIAAMNREKACHLKNGTFGEEWTDKMKPVKITPADWVFRIKHRGPPIDDSQVLPNQYKARVVIKGQFMKEGIDFNDTFAPVAKHVTLRALFAVAAKHGCKLLAGDVETAFLSSPIDCEIWIKMPPFWGKDADPITGIKSDRPPRRLLKGVPGIPQGSRLFYTAMATELKLMHYNPSAADQCLFFSNNNQERLAVLLWVDDFLLMYEKESTATAFLARLRQRFNIPTVGPLNHFLGMDIQYKPEQHKMFISQEHTVDVLLERAQMQDCNPVQTPCPAAPSFRRQTVRQLHHQKRPSTQASSPWQITSPAGHARILLSWSTSCANSWPTLGTRIGKSSSIYCATSKAPSKKAFPWTLTRNQPSKDFMVTVTRLTRTAPTPDEAPWRIYFASTMP